MSFIFPFSPHLKKPPTLHFLQQSNPDTNPRGSQVNLFASCSWSIESTGSVSIGVGQREPTLIPLSCSEGWLAALTAHPGSTHSSGGVGDRRLWGQVALAAKGATTPVSHTWLWLLRMLWLSCPTHGSAGDTKRCPHGLVALLRVGAVTVMGHELRKGHGHQCRHVCAEVLLLSSQILLLIILFLAFSPRIHPNRDCSSCSRVF